MFNADRDKLIKIYVFPKKFGSPPVFFDPIIAFRPKVLKGENNLG